LAYNRVSAFIGQGITPSQQDFEHWWTEFRKENGYATEQPTEPTYEQRKCLYHLLYASNGMGNAEFEVSVDSVPKVFLRRKSDGRSMCAISPAKYDYAFINGGISFETACATVGMNIEPTTPETMPEYVPTTEQCEALWSLVKDGNKSLPGAIPYKTLAVRNHPSVRNLVQVEVQDNFEFTVSPTTFYPLTNSKGERPTFYQCCQAVAGTLFSTLQSILNDAPNE